MTEIDLPDLSKPYHNLYYALLPYYLAGYWVEVGEDTEHHLHYEQTHIYWIPTQGSYLPIDEPEDTFWIISPWWTLNRQMPWRSWRVWKLPSSK